MKKRRLLHLLVCLCCIGTAAFAENNTSADNLPLEDFHFVVVVMHDGGEQAEVENILLIAIHQSTGKALKATFHPAIFCGELFDVNSSDSIAELLQWMEKELTLPLDKYVSIGSDVFSSAEDGSAKEKSMWDLIDLGFSLIGSTNTNLSMGETITTFRRAFAQKEESLEISLPSGTNNEVVDSTVEPPWDEMRGDLFDALTMLQ